MKGMRDTKPNFPPTDINTGLKESWTWHNLASSKINIQNIQTSFALLGVYTFKSSISL